MWPALSSRGPRRAVLGGSVLGGRQGAPGSCGWEQVESTTLSSLVKWPRGQRSVAPPGPGAGRGPFKASPPPCLLCPHW